MKKSAVLLSLTLMMLLGGTAGLCALGLDLELTAGGGMAMGTTDDADKSGALRYALVAGVAADLYLLEWPRASFGLSVGAGYANLHYHGVDSAVPNPFFPLGPATVTQTSDSTYNYVLIPVTLVGRTQLGGQRALTVRAGGFAGYFLSGTTDLTYSEELDTAHGYPADAYSNGPQDLNNTNTEQWMYGLSLYAGLDLLSKGRISVVPSLQFDIGLTDTSIDSMQPTPSNDTFWYLTANVGIRYSLLQ
jgi:hypothetical protein